MVFTTMVTTRRSIAVGIAARDDIGAQLVDLHFQRIDLLIHIQQLVDIMYISPLCKACTASAKLVLDRTAHAQDFRANLLQLGIKLRRDMCMHHR